MRNPQGYAVITDPQFGIKECDTYTCNHCNCVKHVKPKEKPEDIGGLCRCCMKLICSECVSIGVCDPFMKKLEREEARYHALRSYV